MNNLALVMQRSLTFLLRLLSGMVEFQPHVWMLPCSDLRMCHLVFRLSLPVCQGTNNGQANDRVQTTGVVV